MTERKHHPVPRDWLHHGVKGPSSKTLKNTFVVVMAVLFVGEFLMYFGNIFGLHNMLVLLTVLGTTEVVLWFAQILLWSRGEDIFEKFEPKLEEAIETLEHLGFVAEFVGPSIDALKAITSGLTEDELKKVRAVQFATSSAYILALVREMQHADSETVERVTASYEEAQKLWRDDTNT